MTPDSESSKQKSGAPVRPPEVQDFAAEVRLSRSPLVRWLLVTIGTLSLGAGILGAFLPVLPTTPFVLLAAACYAHSSVRFYNWLMNQRLLGPYIRRWRQEGTIPLKAKVMAITMIVVSIGSSIVFFIPILAVKILVGAIGAAVIVYLLRIPTSAPGTDTGSRDNNTKKGS